MNTTPYTDDQILEALEEAFEPDGLNEHFTRKERLQIGKKFLELLSKTQPEQDPYARLKAYAKAGARIRLDGEYVRTDWTLDKEFPFRLSPEKYEVHPDDLHLLEVKPWTPKPGDVVQLKSGGAKMTVRLPQDDNYLCTWTSDYGVFERFFPLACLQQA